MEPEPEPEQDRDQDLGKDPNLTMSEISFHGSVNSHDQLIIDGQDPSSLFKVPKNVTVMFRGGFGFSQYKIPGTIDTMMGRDRGDEPFSMMLKRHNDKEHFYGSLCYFEPESTCINLALQDEPLLYASGKDRDFAITINNGTRIGDSLDIKASGNSDDKFTITSICKNKEQKKYFHTLSHKHSGRGGDTGMRSSFCQAAQKLEQGFRYIYLREVINLLADQYKINDNNQLVVYVSSCQVIDEDWAEETYKKDFQKFIDISLKSQQRGRDLYNPDELSALEKGKTEEEISGVVGTDFKTFFGSAEEGYLYIPDNRGTEFDEWYAEMFPDTKKKKRKTARIKKKRKRKKNRPKKTKRRKSKKKR